MSRPSNPIREARHRAGMTMKQLADAVGISKGAVGQWEMHNNPTCPDPQNAIRLTQVLPGLTLEEIFQARAA